MFLQRQLDDLLTMFGTRRCQSATESDSEEKEIDPRIIRSFPMSPGLAPVIVERPPKPFFGKIINNCYAISYRELGRPMKKLIDGVNKTTQKGGNLENDLHRADTKMVSQELEY